MRHPSSFGCLITVAIGCIATPSLAQVAASPPQSEAASPTVAASPAASEPQSGLGEIVVTAQRTAQKLQDVPISVAALTPAMIASQGITDTTSLNGKVPSLSISVNGPQNVYFIRGVGSPVAAVNGEQSVATYVDGVYIYAPVGNIMPLGSDLDRLEVLKGPQGTLFGRNATAGVIQIVTKDPKQTPFFEGNVGYGDHNTFNGNFYGTAGVTDNLAIAISGTERHQGDGYGTDLTTGKDTYKTDSTSLRVKGLWTPTSTTEVRASFTYTHMTGTIEDASIIPGHIQLTGAPAPDLGAYNSLNDFPDTFHAKTYFGIVQIDQDLGFAKLENIVSYRDVSDAVFKFDDDVTSASLINATVTEPSKVWTEELRLMSQGNSKLTWVAGLYYIHAKTGDLPIELSGAGINPVAPTASLYEFDSQLSEAIAGFGQATYEIIPKLHVTGGIRFNHETVSHDGTTVEQPLGTVIAQPTPASNSYNNVSWRGSIDYKFTSTILGYGSVSRGYKAGGYNLTASPGVSYPPFKPEQLTAYEVGVKSEFFNHRLRLNIAGYYYDYKNIQVQSSVTGGSLTQNGPSATFKGIDADIAVELTRGLTLTGGANYVHGRYGKFPNATSFSGNPLLGATFINATGNTTVYTPAFSATLGLDYSTDTSFGKLGFNVNGSYTDKVYTAVDNRLTIPSYALANASVTWKPNTGPFNLRLWVLNAFDKKYYNNRLEAQTGDWQIWAPPRTFGFTIGVKLGG